MDRTAWDRKKRWVGKFCIEVGNGLGGMNLDEQYILGWHIRCVSLCPSLGCRCRSSWAERLDLAWEWPLDWGVYRDHPGGNLQNKCNIGRGGQARLGHWMWNMNQTWWNGKCG